jgi:hypothetical protein
VKTDGMPSTAGSPDDLVAAHVHMHVPGLKARAEIDLSFPAPAGSDRED